MFYRARHLLIAGLATVAGATFVSPAIAQQQPPAGVDVLARGPVHEAFAATAEQPAPTPVLNRRPPEPVEELPPDERPEGENVSWIPGYWHYDEERTDFIWISGFWRATPPGRVWVAGSWREVPGGHQWVQGFWQDVAPSAPNQPAEPQIEYLPAPPQPIEFAPSVPAPTTTSFYVSGSWVWRTNRFMWRPGFWINHRPGWIWTPAFYRWTPAGYVFVDGYWDYPLAARGTLFAPVYFQPGILRPAYVYTPYIVVNEPCLHTSLFVRRGWGNYYFGDYFEPRYATVGFNAWFGTPRGSGFAIGVTLGNPRPHYDPLWDYYRIQNANNPKWAIQINDVYVGRYNGSVPRPPRTLVQQTTVINNITNVTNNTTIVNNNTVNNNNKVVNNNTTNNSNLMMLTPLKEASKTNSNIVLKPVSKDQIVAEQKAAKDLQNVSVQRSRLETKMAQQNGIPTMPTTPAGGTAATPKIQSIKLDTPKQAVARAQVTTNDAKFAPPPNPVKLKNEAPATVNTTTTKPNTPTTTTPVPTPKPGTPAPLPTTPVKPEVKPGTPVPTPTPVKPITPAPAPGTKIEIKPSTPVPAPTGKPENPMPSTGTPKIEIKPNMPVPVPAPGTGPAPTIKPPVPGQPAPVIKQPLPTPNPTPPVGPGNKPPVQRGNEKGNNNGGNNGGGERSGGNKPPV